jgi:hypothetical protein
MSFRHTTLHVGAMLVLACCGGSTEPRLGGSPLDNPSSTDEICDGLDNDLNGEIDELFRDEEGRYVADEHCGACGRDCAGAVAHATATLCGLVGGVPACMALGCEPGWEPLPSGICVPWDAHMCLTCLEDEDCGGFVDARCALIAGESRCTVSCTSGGCPSGYACREDRCEPSGGSCSCGPGDAFEMACRIDIIETGEVCVGHATCTDGVITDCSGTPELCDGRDNNCDGEVDEDFVDDLGVYSHINHCGQCGIDCEADIVPFGDLTCGGDPYSPICHLLCADTLDGLHLGDEVDADLIIANGCECIITTLDDPAGPVHAYGPDLDTNCDGADGIVRRSFYVAPDGDDTNAGSPMRPLLTISEGVQRAADSLATDTPKPDVFVVSGTYIEIVDVPDGVRLHGGYRNDFLGLDPDGYITLLISSDPLGAPGGAALVMDGAGVTTTVVEGLHIQGSDAPGPSQPTFGMYVSTPGPALVLRNLTIHSGRAGSGTSGSHGRAGDPPGVLSSEGDPIRASIEDTAHQCIPGTTNRVLGGDGGTNRCDGRREAEAGTRSAQPSPRSRREGWAACPAPRPPRAATGGAEGWTARGRSSRHAPRGSAAACPTSLSPTAGAWRATGPTEATARQGAPATDAGIPWATCRAASGRPCARRTAPREAPAAAAAAGEEEAACTSSGTTWNASSPTASAAAAAAAARADAAARQESRARRERRPWGS